MVKKVKYYTVHQLSHSDPRHNGEKLAPGLFGKCSLHVDHRCMVSTGTSNMEWAYCEIISVAQWKSTVHVVQDPGSIPGWNGQFPVNEYRRTNYYPSQNVSISYLLIRYGDIYKKIEIAVIRLILHLLSDTSLSAAFVLEVFLQGLRALFKKGMKQR